MQNVVAPPTEQLVTAPGAASTPTQPQVSATNPAPATGATGLGSLPPGTAPAPATAPDEGDIKTLNRIIKAIKTAMLVTHGHDGLHARPMGTAEVDFDFDKGEAIYFVTHANSAKVSEIRANPEVALVFSDDAHQRWASLSAKAQVIEDVAKAKELWSPMFNAWFPNGPETPGVALVKAVPSCGCYWEGTHMNRLNIMFAALTARVTGQPIRQDKTQETKHVIFPTPAGGAAGTTSPQAPAATTQQTVA